MSKGAEFRRLLATGPFAYTSGVYTPIEARIAEAVGLKCVYMSGYSCAVGYLGRADLGFPTMTEMTGWAKSIASVIDIPVIADADDGYGNALIVTRTVEEFEKTGVAGIHIEDQRFPKRCGHLAGKYCLPIEEAVMKLKAALDARSDPDFFIIARTDAVNAVGGSMEEAIERGSATPMWAPIWSGQSFPPRTAETPRFMQRRCGEISQTCPSALTTPRLSDGLRSKTPSRSRNWGRWAISSYSSPWALSMQRCTANGTS